MIDKPILLVNTLENVQKTVKRKCPQMLGCKELKKESAARVEQTFELFPCIICVNSTHCLQSIKLGTKSIEKSKFHQYIFDLGVRNAR